jgi:hypothetical protein
LFYGRVRADCSARQARRALFMTRIIAKAERVDAHSLDEFEAVVQVTSWVPSPREASQRGSSERLAADAPLVRCQNRVMEAVSRQATPDADFEESVEILRLLADRTRLQILVLLSEGEISATKK